MGTDTSSSTIHITTAIPYVNAKPHLGHVLEWFQADTLARYYRLRGFDVSFAAGADENSLKNVQAAEKAGVTPQDWLDQYSAIFAAAYEQLGISLTTFRRGSDQTLHWPGVQKLWELCSHDMYKKSYQGWYCVGCEAFYTQDELVNGTCPEHFTKPELIEEENYFFRLSKYQDQIAELIESDKLAIFSDQYKQEMLGFVKHGLEDFSVSRSINRGRGVGVPVPNDDTQVMYVWFDALSIYMTSIGWGYDKQNWQKYWESAKNITHVIGKGINRFHSVYWIGMLLSAGLRVPDVVAVHGYITANGQKMSKSLGNVIDPFEVVTQYGLEPIRYYLLKYIPTHNDGDFSHDKFKEVYTADLANGLGNVCSRIAKLAEKTGVTFQETLDTTAFDPDFNNLLERTEIDKALNWVQQKISALDEYLSTSQPWKLEGEEQKDVLRVSVTKVVEIAHHLQPFMPETANTILKHFTAERIEALQPLFPRLES